MAAWCMPAPDERERAVAEVAQVYERIKIQQPLLLLHYSSHQPPSPTAQLAQSLLSDALRALNVALSVMKQQQQPALPAAAPVTPITSVVKAEPQLSPPSPASADSEAIATTDRRARKRSRSSVMEGNKTSSSSWVDFTIVPYEDGYEWRKYGEKKINGTSYTRSYFRCTYKDETGCLATKHVQQKDSSSDPPLFQVTYNNKHTCNNCTSTTTAAANSSNDRWIINSPLMNGHHHASMMSSIKQEPPVLLLPPTLVQASTALRPFDDQTQPCQQEPSFPVSMQQQRCGIATSTTSSCISGESCDEYSASAAGMAQMAAAEASPGYDLLYEELSLLCDSFKVY